MRFEDDFPVPLTSFVVLGCDFPLWLSVSDQQIRSHVPCPTKPMWSQSGYSEGQRVKGA